MKSTGIVRKLDSLGRVVIPIELRRILEIDEKDPVEIFVEDNRIILQKYEPFGACALTGEISSKNIRIADGKLTLSPEGMKILLKELGRYMKTS
jgi:AbrB family transcriptional regulator, transcriptional pleiotropic regulator of transition state genes